MKGSVKEVGVKTRDGREGATTIMSKLWNYEERQGPASLVLMAAVRLDAQASETTVYTVLI